MNDFFERLGEELDAAARRVARPRRGGVRGWSRRTLVFAALALLAVVAVPAAAVTGVFTASSPTGPSGRTSPGIVDVEPPCVDNREPVLATTTDPPPTELTAVLGVLRRPQRPSDRYPSPERLAPLPVTGVNLDAIRLAHDAHGLRIYLVPAQNVRYFHPPPESDACERFVPPHVTPAAGVCLVESGSDGGAGCNDIASIRKGYSMLTSGGSRHGQTRVAGIVPDGVSAVIWRVRRGPGFLDTRIPVHDNLYAATVPGRAGHGLYVYWVTPAGRKLVRGPHRFTKRELAQLRREKARDQAAGPKPTIFPPSGTASTIFTFRMRVARPTRGAYIARWTGPGGSGCDTGRVGLLAALNGEQRGFMKAGFGPPRPDRKWCPGSYSGTVTSGNRVIGHFAFSVR